MLLELGLIVPLTFLSLGFGFDLFFRPKLIFSSLLRLVSISHE
jgi:hypothetical protein